MSETVRPFPGKITEYEGPVHGGAARAWLKSDSVNHCNAYCRPPVHCDLNYGGPDWTLEDATRVASHDLRLLTPARLVRVERAYEAPPVPVNIDDWFVTDGVKLGAEHTAWLVFWEPVK